MTQHNRDTLALAIKLLEQARRRIGLEEDGSEHPYKAVITTVIEDLNGMLDDPKLGGQIQQEIYGD